MRDLLLTKNGDLAESDPMIDVDELLIINSAGNISRNVILSNDNQFLMQQIMCRLKTVETDWYTYPAFGASLEEFIGLPNILQTALLIEAKIKQSLTYDDLLNINQVSIYSVPINENEIVFYLKVETDSREFLTIPIRFDNRYGFIEGED